MTEIINLREDLLRQIENNEVIKPKVTVTAYTSTRDRHFTTLPLLLFGLLHQTRKPDKIVIYDDSPNKPDLQNHWMFKHIFGICNILNVPYYVFYGQGKGQVLNHQHALMTADTDIVWRLDDDNYPEPNVLETLLRKLEDDTVGAVGCNVWHPDRPIYPVPSYAFGKMTKGVFHQVPEWFYIQDGQDRFTEHLYSTFAYKTKIARTTPGYPMDLSPVGHHEETIFSHQIYRTGHKLVVTPDCKVWHLRNPEGGIRAYRDEFLWKHDQDKMDVYMKNWGYNDKPTKFAILKNGIGDQFAFKTILPEFVAKYKDTHDLVISSSNPDVFHDSKDVFVMNLNEVTYFVPQDKWEEYNVYRIMAEQESKGQVLNLIDSYRKLYQLEN